MLTFGKATAKGIYPDTFNVAQRKVLYCDCAGLLRTLVKIKNVSLDYIKLLSNAEQYYPVFLSPSTVDSPPPPSYFGSGTLLILF